MTSLANDQGFASVLKHDLRPKGSIFSHRGKFGKSAHLVNDALLVFDGAEFTSARYESSDHLPSLIGDHGGEFINQDKLLGLLQKGSPQPGQPLVLSSVRPHPFFLGLSLAT